MSGWIWHRRSPDCLCGGQDPSCPDYEIIEYEETEGLTPPAGRGWTLVPGIGPGIGEISGIDSYTPTRQSVGKRSRRASEDAPRA